MAEDEREGLLAFLLRLQGALPHDDEVPAIRSPRLFVLSVSAACRASVSPTSPSIASLVLSCPFQFLTPHNIMPTSRRAQVRARTAGRSLCPFHPCSDNSLFANIIPNPRQMRRGLPFHLRTLRSLRLNARFKGYCWEASFTAVITLAHGGKGRRDMQALPARRSTPENSYG